MLLKLYLRLSIAALILLTIVQLGIKALVYSPIEVRAAPLAFVGRAVCDPTVPNSGLCPYDIWIIHPDHDEPQRLAVGYIDNQSLAWSPDNTRLAFGGADLSIVDVATGEITNLTHTPNFRDVQPMWSPDGTMIAFVTYQADDAYSRHGLAIIDLATGERQDIFVPTPYVRLLAWSPDSQQLLVSPYTGNNYDPFDFYTFERGSTSLVNLTDSPNLQEYAGSWSHDGRYIAFTELTIYSYAQQVYLIHADGRDLEQLTNSSEFKLSPHWVLDDCCLVYSVSSSLYGMDMLDIETHISVEAIRGLSLAHADTAPNGDEFAYFYSPPNAETNLCIVQLQAMNETCRPVEAFASAVPVWGN